MLFQQLVSCIACGKGVCVADTEQMRVDETPMYARAVEVEPCEPGVAAVDGTAALVPATGMRCTLVMSTNSNKYVPDAAHARSAVPS